MREAVVRHPGAFGQSIRCAMHGATDDQGCHRVAQGGQFVQQGAADGQRAEVGIRQMTVQGVGDVRHQHRAQPEAFQQILQVLEVADRQPVNRPIR